MSKSKTAAKRRAHDIAFVVLAAIALSMSVCLFRALSDEQKQDLLKATCVAECPCECQLRSTDQHDWSTELALTLQELECLPGDSLASYRKRIDHLELYRQLVVAKKEAQEIGPNANESSRARHDLGSLILGVYLRSLPYSVGLSKSIPTILQVDSITSPRVKALILAFAATDGLSDVGPDVVSSPPEEKMRDERLDMLRRALSIDPHCLYAHIASIGIRTAEIEKSVLLHRSADLVDQVRLLEDELLAEFCDWLISRTLGHSRETLLAALDPRQASFGPQRVLSDPRHRSAYCIIFNNVVDLEGIRSCCLPLDPKGVSILERNASEIVEHSRPGGRGGVYQVSSLLHLTMSTTLQELRWTLGRAGHTELSAKCEGGVQSIINTIYGSAGSTLDGREASRLLRYLRNGSQRLEGAWSIAWFDAECAAAARQK